MQYRIRNALVADQAEIARLFTLLGHPCSATDVAARWDAWLAEGNSALVAEGQGGALAGIAALHSMRMLHKAQPVGRVTALVVDTPLQGSGIGRALMAAAEAALTAAGCASMEITSHVDRVQAHAFYQSLDYSITSVRLNKVLPAPLPHYGR